MAICIKKKNKKESKNENDYVSISNIHVSIIGKKQHKVPIDTGMHLI